jgi:hypothetical protein
MKENVLILRTRSDEEQRDHFLERLWERYGIVISNEEYINYCNAHGIFHGAFSKNKKKTIGWIFINETKVWVLRDGELNRLATCYPPIIEHSDCEMIKACFTGVARMAAMQIYEMYLLESAKISKMKFDSVKDAAIFFFSKTKFAPLHIDKYKHGAPRTVRVASLIGKTLTGASEYIELSLKRKSKK